MSKRSCAACLALIVLLFSWGCKPTAEAPPAEEPVGQAVETEDSVWEKADVPISGGTDYRLDKIAFNCEWALKEGIADEARLNAALKKFRVNWLTGRRDEALKDAGEALGLSEPLDPFVEWEALNAWKDGEGVTVALDYRLGDSAAPELMPEPNPKQRFFALLHIPSDPELKPRVKKTFTFIEPFEDAAEKKTEPKVLDFKGDPFVLYYDEGCGFWMSERGAQRIPILDESVPPDSEIPYKNRPESVIVQGKSDALMPTVVQLNADPEGNPKLHCYVTSFRSQDPLTHAALLQMWKTKFIPIQLGDKNSPEKAFLPPWNESGYFEDGPGIRIVMGWDNPVVLAGEGTLFVPDRENRRWRDLNFYPPETDIEDGYLGFATDWEVIMIPAGGKARDLKIFRAKIEDADTQPN